jgi:hypothetical protein
MKPSAILPAFVSGTLAGAGVYGIFLPNDAKGYVTVIFAFLLTAFWVAAGLSLRASANEIPTGGKAAFPELGATWIVAARESIRKRVAGGASSGVPKQVAEQVVDEFGSGAAVCRSVAASAVYVGLAGTLIGLTFAVTGFRSLGSDTETLKTQILVIVGGFGSAFVSALFGVLVTLQLSWQLNRFDEKLEGFERELERYLAEEVMPSVATATGNALADSIVRGMREALSVEIGKVANVFANGIAALRQTAQTTEEAFARVKATNEALLGLIGKFELAASTINSNAGQMQEVMGQLKDATEKLRIVVKPIHNTATSMDEWLAKQVKAIEGLEPLLKNSAGFSLAVVKASESISSFVGASEGVSQGVRDSLVASDARLEASMQLQTAELRSVVGSFADELGRLRSLLSQYSEMLHAMPLSVPAAALMRDLNGAVTETKELQYRDANQIAAARADLETAEASIRLSLGRIESEFAQLRKSVEEAKKEAASANESLEQVTARMERPVWKKLLGKP